MRHSLPLAPQFYVTAPQPCPYLAGRMERKLFTALQGEQAGELNDALSKQGFRRSQNVLYRPSCADCAACLSARIDVAAFRPTKSQRRVMRRNAALSRTATSPWASDEQYDLFRTYLDGRHGDGGMADMDMFEFAAMVEETPIRTRVIEYRTGEAPAPGREAPLAAASLTDVLDDGLSMVYSFFDPALQPQSPGTYMILDHIALAREQGLPYVYLGYWVPGSPKMGYKANFSGLQVYRGGQWQTVTDPFAYSADTHPLSVDPIAEQVGRITLPGVRPVGR
ncbi:arginyltransferase [Wenxinia saemankumensis]|uniref:Aspartate/glutamate leucyltransferase n=1 Tax=Wenxinia saemankumensis TaxID=1447782 RepID=A0A1M6AIF4_9RHOB|nr:arginyltransferase [Wenxinia saemankumensis]SHI36171.1 arginine-tRNA-protein transferase [Wenxinia saemankumensis]